MEDLTALYRSPTPRGLSFLQAGLLWIFWPLLGLLAGLLLWYYLPWGAWARTDSVAYVEAARHVAQGLGLYVYDEQGHLEWLSHYPPFYPLTLVPFLKAGLSWHQATRWDAALAYGLLVTLLGLMAWSITRRFPESLSWTLLLALAPPLLVYVSGAMSEAWFYVWMWLALFGWWKALKEGRSLPLLWAGLATGLALWTRYAGFFLLGGVVFVLAGYPQNLRSRWAAALRFVLPALLVYAIWVLLMVLHGKGVHTHFPLTSTPWLQAFAQFQKDWPEAIWRGWVMLSEKTFKAHQPWLRNLAFALPALMALLGGVALFRYRALQGEMGLAEGSLLAPRWLPQRLAGWWLWTALSTFTGLGYLLFLILARVIRDPQPDFTPRVLSPALFFGLAGLLSGLQAVLGEIEYRKAALRRPWPRGLWAWGWTSLLLAGLWFGFLPKTASYLHVMRLYGNGYTRKMWHEPEFWAYVRSWPPDILMLSTEAYVTRLWSGRFAAWPREAFNPRLLTGPLGTNPRDPYHRAFREGRAVLIHLRPAGDTWWKARWGQEGYRASKIIRTGLPRCYEHPLAIVYFAGKDPERCPLQRQKR